MTDSTIHRAETIGERIRQARLGRTPKVTLAELAAGRLSVSLVSKIERGLVRPSLTTLEHIGGRLGIPASELLGGRPTAATDGSNDLALLSAAASMAGDDPAAALAALGDAGLDPTGGLEAAAVRAAALLALDRDDEALRLSDRALRVAAGPNPDGLVPFHLVRATALARAGRLDAAQEAFGRVLEGAPADRADWRADALLGLAALAERSGSPSTARNFQRQALTQLGLAASPTRRAGALRQRAASLAAGGQLGPAAEALAAAAELSALARAATLRAETAARLAEPSPAGAMPSTRLREASDQIGHRSVRRDRNPG